MLVFVGVKMLVSDLYHVPIWLSLVVIATAIAVSVVVSLRRAPTEAAPSREAQAHDKMGAR